MNNWHSIKKEEVLKKLKSSTEGLSKKEAEIRLKRYGKNIIKDDYKINPLKIFFLQFKSWFIYILLAGVVISVLIQHYLDASVIFAIVLLNAFIGFVQQYKAEKSMLELKKLLNHKTKVFREGKLSVENVEEIVIGDLLVLKSGDKIPADCRIISFENLEVNEAILTGESIPVEKTSETITKNAVLVERRNILYAGTYIEKGNCRAIVVNTGMNTEFGKIAGMLKEFELEDTPMQKKIDNFAKKSFVFILGLVIILFFVGLIFGQEKYQMLLTAIALAVSAVPEGLSAVITLGLAFASGKMAKYNVLIRRLPAAETLGSVSVICSDKTGTMTEGKMKVVEIFSNNKIFIKENNNLFWNKTKINLYKEKELNQLVKTSILCNNARFEIKENPKKKEYEIIGDSTESALVSAALDLGINKKLLCDEEKRIKEFSFSSERKIMSILSKNRIQTLYSKGAPEIIIKKSSFEFINGRQVKLNEERKKDLIEQAEKMQEKSLRVLGFAFKFYKNEKNPEEALIFLGLIGLQDPPRKEVKGAVELCKKAGIKVKMITGDSEITAKAIAEQVGIYGELISGKKLDSLSDEQLIDKIENIQIFARIEPKQKLRIIEILKMRGEQVAVTGDGINDVLALKKANIGIAMGLRGSDVAREVSDIILIDDNFASIVKAVEEGRTIYDNTKKITKFLLAVNFSEIFLISVIILLGFPLPFLPLQILWMNLITDSIPAFALTKEKSEDVMKRKPLKEKSILDGILLYVIIAGIVTLLAEIFIFFFALNKYNINEVRTLVVTGGILFEFLFVFTCRSNKKLKDIGIFSNKWVFYGIILSILIHLFVLYTPISSFFGFTPLSLKQWLLIIPFSFLGLILFEIRKYIKKSKNKN